MKLTSVSSDLNNIEQTIINPERVQGALDSKAVSLIDPTAAPKQGSKALKVLAIALIIISIAVILASIAFGIGIAITGATPFIAALKAPWAIVASGVAGTLGIMKLISGITLLKYATTSSDISIQHVYKQAPQPDFPEVPVPIPATKQAAPAPAPSKPTYVTPPPPPARTSKPPIPKSVSPVPYKGERIHNKMLNEIPLKIFDSNDWTSLSFPKNYITEVPPAIGNFSHLTHLDLSGNSLTFLPDEIEFLTELKKLDLHYNHLRTITPSINKLINLEELNLWYNDLKTLPEFGNLTKLKTLSLRDNKRLTTLPDCFEHLTALNSIDLGVSGFSKFPPSFRFLTNLTSLNLEHCYRLKEIPAFIWDLPKVCVSISENQKDLLPPNLDPSKFYINN